MTWNNQHLCGYLPEIISERNPGTVKEQIERNYAHGGGYNPFQGFDLVLPNKGPARIIYPGDPPMMEIARTVIRGEAVILFQYSWVAIIQANGAYEIVRMD